jgi:hypothetical protein
VALAVSGLAALAAPEPIRPEVRGLLGRVRISRPGGPALPLKAGSPVAVGDTIQTERGAAVDLYLGDQAGTVRVTELSTLVIEEAVLKDPASGSFEVKLALKSGELLGRVMPQSLGSRFQVATPAGIGAVADGQFRIDARGYFVLLDGKAIFVHAPGEAEPVAHSLKAPPAMYFSPRSGLQTAPEELVREVAGQTRSKLPGR